MQISLDHLCSLFANSYKPEIDDFWRTEGPHLSPLSHSEYRQNPKYLKALEEDINTFCCALPIDGQTAEVKTSIKTYWLQRGLRKKE